MPGYDIRTDNPRLKSFYGSWWIRANAKRITPGDMFALYLHPETCFYAVGVFDSHVNGDWVGVNIRRLKTPLRKSKLARLAAWRTKKGTLAKPYSKNPDGTPNAVFANGIRIPDDRWRTIWDRIDENDRKWLTRESGKFTIPSP